MMKKLTFLFLLGLLATTTAWGQGIRKARPIPVFPPGAVTGVGLCAGESPCADTEGVTYDFAAGCWVCATYPSSADFFTNDASDTFDIADYEMTASLGTAGSFSLWGGALAQPSDGAGLTLEGVTAANDGDFLAYSASGSSDSDIVLNNSSTNVNAHIMLSKRNAANTASSLFYMTVNNQKFIFDPAETGNEMWWFKGLDLRMYEDTDSFYALLNVPALAANTNFTLPPDNGTNTWLLQTDGSGVTSWVNPASVGVTDHGALSGLADDDHALYLDTTADDTFSDPSWLISADTGDGFDTYVLGLAAGGLANSGRGAYLTMVGNDLGSGTDGDVILSTGDANSAVLSISNPSTTGSIVISNEQGATDNELTIDGSGFLFSGNAGDDVVLGGGIDLGLTGSTSGVLTQNVPATVTDYAVTWPSAQASGTKVLSNDGAGNLSWETDAGGVTDHGALTGLSDDDHALYLDTTADDTFSATNWDITADTSDGSDTKEISIRGGGGIGTGRGGTIQVAGNEHGDSGGIFITAGDDADGDIQLLTTNSGGVLTLQTEAGATDTKLVMTDVITFSTDGTGDTEFVVPNDSIALGTETNGNYAAGDAEAGNATGLACTNCVAVSELATGTDGELITWDASGNPAAVSVGTSGQVLTSNGAGAAPTFQAAAGAAEPRRFYFDAQSCNPAVVPSTAAEAGLIDDTNNDWATLLFDDTAQETCYLKLAVPPDVDTSGTVTFRVAFVPILEASGKNVRWDFDHSNLANAAAIDTALTADTSGDLSVEYSLNNDVITIAEWTDTVSGLGWAAEDQVFAKFSRDPAATDDITGDVALISLEIEIPTT